MRRDNAHSVLGLREGATEDEIKAAFRKKSKECHPDLFPGDATKEEEFKSINEAHQLLTSASKGYSEEDFENDLSENDVFEMMFRTGNRRAFSQMHMQTTVPYAIARDGGTHEIKIPLASTNPYDFGVSQKVITKTLKIPKDMENFHGFVFRGEGADYDRLVVTCEIEPPAGFRLAKDRKSLYTVYRIDMMDAILGMSFNFPFGDTTIRVTVPPGTQPGQILRIPNKGFKLFNSSRGDLLLHMSVIVPKLDKRCQEILRKAREEMKGETPQTENVT